MALNNGGCFSGSTLVSMEDNSKMQISFLKVGDMVNTLAGMTNVEHIIPFHFSGFMYNIGNHASVSAYHPIIKNNSDANNFTTFKTEYFFPKYQKCQNIYYKGIVYQLVLENRSHIAIGSDNGCYAGTFNNIIDFEIFGHPYCDTSNMDINMIGDIVENDPESVITKRY